MTVGTTCRSASVGEVQVTPILEKTLPTNAAFIALEEKNGCFNYSPLPVVLKKGRGCKVTDVEGKEYYDCLAGYGAVNQGHCHPRLVEVMKNQCSELTLTSRAFHNDKLPGFCEFMTKRFGYDRVLPMNSGVEGADSAIKIMRRYAYEQNKVADGQAVILFPKDNFWGRSLAACSASTDPDCRVNYGPFMEGFHIVPYGDLGAIKEAIKKFPGRIAGMYTEPIQGEAGIIVPPAGYLRGAQEILRGVGALLCCDEIQSGLGRTGRMLASDHDDCKPDLVVLGKALSGGMMPVSCVLGSEKVMRVLTPGTHGSTYGGNPLGMCLAIEAIRILDEEKLCENADVMGKKFRDAIIALGLASVVDVRGRGLFNAVEINTNCGVTAYEICNKLLDGGVLAKPTHGNIIRFTPALCITDAEMQEVISIVTRVLNEANEAHVM